MKSRCPCPLRASADQLVLAFLSRSSARVERYLLLTVHSFTPYFRKEVNAKLWDIYRLFMRCLRARVLRRNSWTPNIAGPSPISPVHQEVVHWSALLCREHVMPSLQEELAVTYLRCWIQNWIR